jgi:glutathione synthase/RimK-type ligase-like ATP-grasp enzyme
MCIQVAQGMDLAMSGIDLRLTPAGDYYFFEINPSPAFSFYERRTGQPISKVLAKMLRTGFSET